MKKRGVSLGTIVMLSITAAVLCGFFLLLPSLTGHQDIRLDAARLAVAIDQSLSRLTDSMGAPAASPANTPLPVSDPAPFSQPAPTDTPLPTAVPKKRFSLCLSGNIVWNSDVRNALTIDGQSEYGILTDTIPDLLQADLSLATLQNTLIRSEKASNVNQPADMLLPIRSAGINTLCIAHENVLNGGLAGVAETRDAVRFAGLTPYGAYTSAAERAQGVLVQRQGVSIALLHYQDEVSSTGRKKTSAEEREAALAPIQLPVIAADIGAMRNAGAEMVVVSLYWGKTGAAAPTEEQKALAQSIADAGADVIIGSRSGVLQTVQVLSANRGDGLYHPVLCAYSLGNLFSHERETRATLASLFLKADVVVDSATGQLAFENLAYTPTYAWRGRQNGRTVQRILINDARSYPDFVDKDQKGVMERCYTLVTGVMAETGIPMAN